MVVPARLLLHCNVFCSVATLFLFFPIPHSYLWYFWNPAYSSHCRCSRLMVSVLDSGSSGPGSSPGRGTGLCFQANLPLGVTLQQTSMLSRGEQKYSQLLHAKETRISSGLMGHLARMQTLPIYDVSHLLPFPIKASPPPPPPSFTSQVFSTAPAPSFPSNVKMHYTKIPVFTKYLFKGRQDLQLIPKLLLLVVEWQAWPQHLHCQRLALMLCCQRLLITLVKEELSFSFFYPPYYLKNKVCKL